MPRREGEVFFFGTAIEITPENGFRAHSRPPYSLGRRAYRGSVSPRLARPTQAIGRDPEGPALVNGRQPAHASARSQRAADGWVRQDCRKESGLSRAQVAGRLAEGMTRTRLGAELAGRTPLGNIEINFHQPALAEHKIEPERERKLQCLADDRAARPEKQILRSLLRDGRAAAHLGEIVGIGGIGKSGAQLAEIDAVVDAKARVFGGHDGARQRRRYGA